MPIMPEHVYKDVSDRGGFDAGDAGTGPFKLVNYDRRKALPLRGHENYYQGAPKVKQIKFVKMSLETVRCRLREG